MPIPNFPSQYETAFSDHFWEIQAQQKDHRLADLYESDTISGNQKRYPQSGSSTYAFRQKTARVQKTEWTDLPMADRWVRPRPYDIATVIDEHDPIALGSLGSPKSTIVKNHAIAAARLRDQILLNAALGTNYTGAQGTTATTFLAANQIAVNQGGGANTGMTLAKLILASYYQDRYDVIPDGRVLVLSAKQMNNMLTNVDQVNNSLYNSVQALVNGRITDFMGYKIIETELLPVVSNVRTCLIYQKDYLLLGLGEDQKTHIDVLPENSHATQVRTVFLADATRKEEKGFASIACDESV